MTLSRRELLLVAAASATCPFAARAEPYPNRPVKIVVPYAAGGAADGVTRIHAAELARTLKTPFIVENKPGAGTNIAAAAGFAAAADGYTLFMSNLASNSTNRFFYRKLPYDPEKFTPVAMMAVNTFFLVIPANSPARSIADLVKLAKGRPGGLNYGTNGVGTPSHLLAELFRSKTGISLVHIPYKGSSESNVALMEGSIDFMFDNSAINLVRAGKLRALAVAYESRWPDEQAIPTMAELGVQGVTIATYFGLVAPPNTPPGIVAILNKAVNEVASTTAGLTERLLALGSKPQPGTPDEAGAFMKDQAEKWAPIIQSLNVKLD